MHNTHPELDPRPGRQAPPDGVASSDVEVVPRAPRGKRAVAALASSDDGTHDALRGQVRQDKIDILVDLLGVASGTDLAGLASFRQAPLQLSFHGQPFTSWSRFELSFLNYFFELSVCTILPLSQPSRCWLAYSRRGVGRATASPAQRPRLPLVEACSVKADA